MIRAMAAEQPRLSSAPDGGHNSMKQDRMPRLLYRRAVCWCGRSRLANCRCFVLKENRRICLRYRPRVSAESITRSKRHTHFLSGSVGQVLESWRPRSMLTRTIYLTSGNIITMARPQNRNRPPNAKLIFLRSKPQRRAQRQAREGHQASRWTLPVPDVRHRRDHR